MTERLARAFCVAAVTALALAGCESAAIDSQKAEQEIATGYEKQVKGAKVTSVDCPDEIDGSSGTTAVCRLTLDNGAAGDVDIKVIGDDGRIRWDVASATKIPNKK